MPKVLPTKRAYRRLKEFDGYITLPAALALIAKLSPPGISYWHLYVDVLKKNLGLVKRSKDESGMYFLSRSRVEKYSKELKVKNKNK